MQPVTVTVTATETVTSTVIRSLITTAAIPTTTSFSAGNVQTNFFRGVSSGVSIMTILISVYFNRIFPRRITLIAFMMAAVVLTVQAICLFWDLFPPENCLFRTQIVYSLLFVQLFGYWLFQAELTYKVSQAYSQSVPFSIFIIVIAVLVRVGINLFLVATISAARNDNQTCSTVVGVATNMTDKISEALFSLVLSILFIYPIAAGYKEIAIFANPQRTGRQNASSNPAPAHPATDKLNEGMAWLKRIMMDKGFILILSVFVETLYSLLVFTGMSPPTLVSFWNAVFTPQYLILLTVHMLSTACRKVKETGSATQSESLSGAKH
ncbi:hypothetical protein CcCBS67573_g04003 [Chytriomyces confervae]|uniref:Uncharacterized protein n=1 Tax=Chytriomyces confervae TaxID=246404 RepID=A0A507FHG3_9FUNG|nr:hypothetical protein HDU80_006407 [Chytriomyces hyalinus]TPX74736.1 hypothetical protein CcCBS67573_g04003 [Chytriomyces confervae]